MLKSLITYWPGFITLILVAIFFFNWRNVARVIGVVLAALFIHTSFNNVTLQDEKNKDQNRK